jgi:hypothetical protein
MRGGSWDDTTDSRCAVRRCPDATLITPLFLFQLWESTERQAASSTQRGRRLQWTVCHCGLHGYQVRLQGSQHRAQVGREMPEHRVLRACSHPRGVRPHIRAPSSVPSWVSIGRAPLVLLPETYWLQAIQTRRVPRLVVGERRQRLVNAALSWA